MHCHLIVANCVPQFERDEFIICVKLRDAIPNKAAKIQKTDKLSRGFLKKVGTDLVIHTKMPKR